MSEVVKTNAYSARCEEVTETLKGFVSKWDEILGLEVSGWHIGITYSWHPPIASDPDAPKFGSASSNVDWEYLHGRISFFLPCLLDTPEDELEEIVVHEYMHLMVNEMRETNVKHEERVVSGLARGFMKCAYLSRSPCEDRNQ